MRILFVRSIGKKKYGGGERWVVNAASGLHKNGHFVVVAGKKNSILLKKSETNGLTTYPFSINSDINIFKALKLSRFINKNRIDIIICKGRELVICGIAAKLAGNKVVVRRSGSPPPPKSKKLVIRTKLFVDGVITNTNTIRKTYYEHGFTDDDFVKVIYNGLIINDNIAAYDYSSKHDGKIIVLCIGRLVALEKGYIYLIDAINHIKDKHPDLLFYILGEGKDKNHLIQYADKKNVGDMIHFAGYIDQPVPYIKGCDLFVHPSLFEGMPNAAMEAMAYGKPVIMTHVNGAEELSNNGEYAWLIPPADHMAIANSLIKAIENKKEISVMGEKAKMFVRGKFSMQTMVSSLENYLNECLEKKNRYN